MARDTEDFQFDPEILKKKYDAERDKRLALRPEGEAQFIKMKGVFAHYLEDPYTPRQERAPRSEDVDVAVVGGGFAGLLAAGRLREQGIDNIRIFERGGDFGGTWYWNRYPGAACDVESYVYLPMLEELGAMPSAKYVFAPEILEHVRALARKYDLYSRALLHTVVDEARFDEATSRWVLKTDRGDEIRAKFFILASGHYRTPKLPGIPGIETFKNHSFHTSRWDYAYTGGDPHSPLVNLQDKVVGIIGTGATAIQCVPHLARWSKQLYVFQRTPSSVDVRANRPTDPEWFKSLEPGWQRARMINFAEATMGIAEEDLIQDGWTKINTLIKQRSTPDMTPQQRAELAQMVNYEIMENVRKRVDEVIKDRKAAESLKPWYNWLCKRPCYHDEFLDVFNQPNVTLVDTEGRGVERISEDAVFANGQEFKVDCLIYATGFELSPYEQGAPMPIFGVGGLELAEKWKDGATTLHGIHVNGFPNLMLSGTRQGSWANNFPHAQDEVARHMAQIIRHAKDNDVDAIEVTPEAETDWVQFHVKKAEAHLIPIWRDCTPSYFNNEGHPAASITRDGALACSTMEYAEILRKSREAGMPGLALTSRAKVD
jgi:cation diffusion facilitator CzcD-associated flavoprotein CzcO